MFKVGLAIQEKVGQNKLYNEVLQTVITGSRILSNLLNLRLIIDGHQPAESKCGKLFDQGFGKYVVIFCHTLLELCWACKGLTVG